MTNEDLKNQLWAAKRTIREQNEVIVNQRARIGELEIHIAILQSVCEEVDDMRGEQVDAALRAYGYDPVKLGDEFRELAARELAKIKTDDTP